MINFTLNSIYNTPAFALSPHLSLNWFALTYGDLHLELGEATIYEYSNEAITLFGKSTKYNDYAISRFIEDFSILFENIGQSVPEKFYYLTENLPKFLSDSQKWQNQNKDDNDEFYFRSYVPLLSWIDGRHLDSGHLVGGPNLYFFRHNEAIRIVWETGGKLENGVNIWTAQSGNFEMSYIDFIKKVEDFGDLFFKEMEEKIHRATNIDLGNIRLDKTRLASEHSERIENFSDKLYYLKNQSTAKTNWTKINLLYEKMTLHLNENFSDNR